MISYFRSIIRVTLALFKGLGVTLRHLFAPAVTVQYPFEKLTLSERYRGALAFHPDICVSCDMCVRACPSKCISLTAERNEKTKKKELKWYQIDFAKCNFCRLCEEICPTKPKSIHHTKEFELTFEDRKDFVVRWTPEVAQPAGSAPGQIWSKFLAVAQGKKPAAPKAGTKEVGTK